MDILPFKRCSRCGKTKLLSGFGFTNSDHKYRSGICKACQKVRVDKWKKEHPESVKEYRDSYRADNAEFVRESNRISRQKRYTQNPAAIKEANKRWVSNHLDKKIAINNNRRAREKGSVGKITAQEWQSVLEKYNYKCLCCGRGDVKLTRDHVVPLILGGTNTIDNVQPLCQSCNSKKGLQVRDYR